MILGWLRREGWVAVRGEDGKGRAGIGLEGVFGNGVEYLRRVRRGREDRGDRERMGAMYCGVEEWGG